MRKNAPNLAIYIGSDRRPNVLNVHGMYVHFVDVGLGFLFAKKVNPQHIFDIIFGKFLGLRRNNYGRIFLKAAALLNSVLGIVLKLVVLSEPTKCMVPISEKYSPATRKLKS